jgi:hypothetical protein
MCALIGAGPPPAVQVRRAQNTVQTIAMKKARNADSTSAPAHTMSKGMTAYMAHLTFDFAAAGDAPRAEQP